MSIREVLESHEFREAIQSGVYLIAVMTYILKRNDMNDFSDIIESEVTEATYFVRLAMNKTQGVNDGRF